MREIAVALIALRVCAAAMDGPPSIATDRPSVTDSSIVVPAGSVQIENGFADSAGTLDAPETLLRCAILAKTELRFTAPDDLDGDFGDSAIGVKQQLGPVKGFDVSLVVTLSLPSGARAISSHGYDPAVQLPWSRALSAKWTAAGMLSTYWPTVEGRRNATGESTFLLDRAFSRRCDGFFEYAGDFPERGGPRQFAQVGASYRVTPRQQIDFHTGAGFSRAAPHHLIGIGYSFRWDAIRR